MRRRAEQPKHSPPTMLVSRTLRFCCQRRFLVPLIALALASPWVLKVVVFNTNPKPYEWHVDPKHQEVVHTYVRSVLTRECRPSFARKGIEARIPTTTPVMEPFLWRETSSMDTVFRYPPPFGFLDLQDKLMEVLRLLPPSPTQEHHGKDCQRCVVVGNGGILHGLELGTLIDQFDMVIRLNSGPVQGFSKDVGNRTTIRMSYPEGSPKVWEDMDPQLKYVAVIYKSVDFNWLNAMITKQKVSLWDWLFFWQKVPDEIPIKLSQFYILNPEIIRETALDLLQYPKPKFRLWGWDQNVPTLGMSALNLASYLCDEVSLAGFGYNLSQREARLHYYDSLPMSAMLTQEMHNVDQERALLQSLVAEGTMADLTGGIYCSFCPS